MRDLDVTTEIVIDRPVDEVASYTADPSNAPRWYANIRSVEWESQPPLQIGSRVRFVARFLGRTLDYSYEFVDLKLGERVTMRTAHGPFPMETTYAWTALSPTSTRMTLRNRGRPSGFSTALGAGHGSGRPTSQHQRPARPQAAPRAVISPVHGPPGRGCRPVDYPSPGPGDYRERRADHGGRRTGCRS